MRLLATGLLVLAVLVAPGQALGGQITLDGPGVTKAGRKVTFSGRLRPPRQVEVGIYLGSSMVAQVRPDARGVFIARPHLFTTGSYRARAPGYVSPPRRVVVKKRLLDLGDTGAGVARIARRLDDLGYAVATRSPTSFDGALTQSVYAFQKAQAIGVDGIVGPVTRAKLRDPERVRPRYRTPASHIEVDKNRQLVLVVEGGRVEAVVNTSTAGIPGYVTPEGRFSIFRRVPGISRSSLGLLWDALYFYRGYAIHGSTSVPPHPASHGCVRLPMWEAKRLFETIPHGEVVYVY
jgi:peptidoglycan hydrolase-like protein with peptidoglycan-binding domain